MATPSTVQRATEVGDQFRTFDTGGIKSQAVGIIDENGVHTGVPGNALEVNILSQTADLGIDDSTPIDVNLASQAAATAYTSGGTGVDSALIKASAGVLREISVVLAASVSVDRYLMLFNDVDGIVADATAPVWRVMIPAGGMAAYAFNPGLNFTLGVTAKISSTVDTLTVTADTGAFITALTE